MPLSAPLRPLLPAAQGYGRCTRRLPVRSFTTSPVKLSGHSRWAKIKHDKGKADKAKSKTRSFITQELIAASKYGGPDPALNPRLPALIANAKKLGFPKPSIEAAIARGQGISLSGRALEPMTVDFMFPDLNVAGLIECQTDNKARTMQHIRDALKHHDGTATPASYMFDRRGKLVFLRTEIPNLDENKLFEVAVEAGAEDIDVGTEEVVVLTSPNEVAAVAELLTAQLGMKPERQELVWEPKEDATVELTSESNDRLERFLERLEYDGSVQEVHLNTI